MKLLKHIILASGLSGLVLSCQPEIEVSVPSQGTVDLSHFLAIGNSLTAGYQDGGLYLEGQEQSMPAIIVQQMREINPDLAFNQPRMPENGSGYLKLKALDLANQLFLFDQIPADPTWTDKIPGDYQNLGIVGIRVRDVTVNGYGANLQQGNPYFYRILSANEASKSYLDKISEAEVSIYTCWLGGNDVLGYAFTGGAFGPDGLPGSGANGLTPVNDFESSYDALISVLNSKGAKGVLGTVPDVANIPFFNAIPWNSIVLDEASAALANSVYASQIDPQVRAGVEDALINLVATDTVVSMYVIPDLADTTIWLQTYQAALADGKTQQEAADSAYAFLASPIGMAASARLQSELNAELTYYLLGFPVSPALKPLFDQIGILIATDPVLQAGIAQAEEAIRQAYEAGMIPELEQQVDVQTQNQIEQLKAAGIYPTFEVGPNGFVIEVPVTANNPLGIRQMVEGEKILFLAFTVLADPQAALSPQPDELILTLQELDSIRTFTNDYNEIIRGHESANIGIMETDAVFQKINNGIFLDGTSIDGSYIQGGVFSLDAIHLTPRGYAIVANEFLKVMNEKFSASIPPVNTSTYRAVILP